MRRPGPTCPASTEPTDPRRSSHATVRAEGTDHASDPDSASARTNASANISTEDGDSDYQGVSRPAPASALVGGGREPAPAASRGQRRTGPAEADTHARLPKRSRALLRRRSCSSTTSPAHLLGLPGAPAVPGNHPSPRSRRHLQQRHLQPGNRRGHHAAGARPPGPPAPATTPPPTPPASDAAGGPHRHPGRRGSAALKERRHAGPSARADPADSPHVTRSGLRRGMTMGLTRKSPIELNWRTRHEHHCRLGSHRRRSSTRHHAGLTPRQRPSPSPLNRTELRGGGGSFPAHTPTPRQNLAGNTTDETASGATNDGAGGIARHCATLRGCAPNPPLANPNPWSSPHEHCTHPARNLGDEHLPTSCPAAPCYPRRRQRRVS